MTNKRKNKEEIAEDCCFVCKDGGLLRVCDYKNCLKAYHPQCVGKDSDFLESDEQFSCSWHKCHICDQSCSQLQCFCCPLSFCHGCIKNADFVRVKKQNKGFCIQCLRMAILIEENADADSDGEKVDFNDTETYEFLFKDYWAIVKDRENLKLVELQEAKALLKNGRNCKQGSDSEKLPEEVQNSETEYLEDNAEDDSSFHAGLELRSQRVKKPLKRSMSKKKTFARWGSEELIGFLSSIGKDISRPLTQLDACEIIKEYIQNNKLLNQNKKKKYVDCDMKLRSLFRKKKMKFNRIYGLLESHLAGNVDSEDSEADYFSSEDDGDSAPRKKHRSLGSETKIHNRFSEVNRRCFASIVEGNIKLIYLKKSLVLDLLKRPDAFEAKVVGCFVRVNNDRKDYYRTSQKLYQLGQVTGLKKSPEPYKIGDISTDIVLCVSNICKEVKISLLSDDDFEKEECEDLRELVKKGHLKRPTVAELEDKARSVHEERVSHWIKKELQKLERQIDQANDKGWRRELFEYIDKRELLRKPSERQRLLEEIPQIMADTEEIEAIDVAVGDAPRESKGAIRVGDFSCKSFIGERPEAVPGAASSKIAKEETPEGSEVQVASSSAATKERPEDAQGQGAESVITAPEEILKDTTMLGSRDCKVAAQETIEAAIEDCDRNSASGLDSKEKKAEGSGQNELDHMTTCKSNMQVIDIDEDEDHTTHKVPPTLIIDLDADDEDTPAQQDAQHTAKEYTSGAIARNHNQCIWHYLDPQGDARGPFSMAQLHRWKEAGYFEDDFKIWRTGQPRECAILLTDALLLTTS